MSQTTYSDTVSVTSGRELLGRKVSLYDHTKDVTGRPVALVEIIDGILGGRWKASVDKVRAESDEDRQKEIKKTLPGFTAAGVFKRRNKTSIELPAGLVVIDIDGLGGYEKAVEVRDTLAEDPHVLAGFISVRGEGVKLIVYAGEIATDAEFKAAWRAFAQYAADNYGLSLDPSGKDICRLCFVGNDRGAFVNTGDVQAFTGRAEIEKELPQASTVDTSGNEEAAAVETTRPDWMQAVNEMPSPSGQESAPDAPPVANVRAALCYLDPAMGRDGWLRIAMALKSVYPGKAGFTLFDEWSKRTPDRYGGTVEVWNSIKADGGVTVGTLYKRAEDAGWINPTGRLALSIRRQQAAEQADGEGEVEVEPEAPASPKPWEGITDSQIAEAIDGTLLEPMVRVLSSVTKPPLPMGIALPKAIALAGCALAQPIEYDRKTEERRGIELARNVIETAGGQTLNVMACIVYPSGECKDIGNIPATLTHSEGVNIGNAGSAEGLADAYISNGAGMLIISELQPYLDAKKWQHAATGLLTAGWNQHQIKVVLSRRNGEPRDVRFCAPSVIANVQPQVLAEMADPLLLDSGFLNRFLFTFSDAPTSRRPNTDPISLEPLRRAFKAYRRMQVRVRVPQDYLQNVLDEFLTHDAPLAGHYNRLVNEYGPRLAFMLAVDPNRPHALEITQDHWDRAAVLLRWFFAHACRALEGIGEDRYVRKMEARLARMLAWVRKHPKGISKKYFTQAFHKGTDAADREKALHELEDRGQIRIQKIGNKFMLRPVAEDE